MTMDEIELAVRRAGTQRPELSGALDVVADFLWPGEGVDQVHQAAVQCFLWWDVPKRHDPRDWGALVEATAVLLDAVGRDRLADIARSTETTSVLEAWGTDEAAGLAAFKSARAVSGVEPPDTDVLAWGTVFGPYEAEALEEAERALGDAVAGGELVPGAPRAQATARRITERVLTTALDLPPGQTRVGLITTERISHWIALAPNEELSAWRSLVANRLLSPVGVEDPEAAVAPVRWLLELCAAPEGALLSQSGYLPRGSVAEAAERFGWWDWPKPPRSEADVHQLATIREAARRLHLVRRRGRHLMATSRAKELLARPLELWSIVATETEEGGDFALAVTEAVGLRLLQGRAEVHELAIDVHPVLQAQGWSSGGRAISLVEVTSAIYIPVRWWSIFGILDEERMRWDSDAHRALNPHRYGLRPDGEAMVLAFLRARAVRPRHSVYD
ncbi:MAG TPA: hypothetical protein VMF35_08155 [Acidimicrobiales bacterium]|nr:hypothetical protein [Acidimicrobiales bacterium]